MYPRTLEYVANATNEAIAEVTRKYGLPPDEFSEDFIRTFKKSIARQGKERKEARKHANN